MREKHRAKFLPPYYLQDNYTRLHHLRQETKTVEEYAYEFKRHTMTYDLRQNEDKTLVRYLGGLNEHIWNVVEL